VKTVVLLGHGLQVLLFVSLRQQLIDVAVGYLTPAITLG
jgi:hypothetical protein